MIPYGPLPGAGASALGSDGYIEVLALGDLPPSSQKSVAHGFQRVLLCHTPAGIHAVADLCPHALQPLLGSEINAGLIRCAKHGALFDLVSGKPRNSVTSQSLRIYPVRIRDGRIEVDFANPAK